MNILSIEPILKDYILNNDKSKTKKMIIICIKTACIIAALTKKDKI